MKIAITYICTGLYNVFWDDFYSSCEKYFYPSEHKEYYVFTDNLDIIKSSWDTEYIHCYYQTKAVWPYDTLLRFNYFCTVQDELLKFDYCYYCNANTLFLKTIDNTVIEFPKHDDQLILWRHTTTYDDEYGVRFQPERNPLSTAYIPKGTKCHPFGGGFFGGASLAFVKMSRELRNRVATDLSRGIIAVWHDQSHLIKYANEVDYIEVPKDIIASAEYQEGKDLYAVFISKDKYGGNDRFRDSSNYLRIKNKIIKIAVKISHKTGLIYVYKIIKEWFQLRER